MCRAAGVKLAAALDHFSLDVSRPRLPRRRRVDRRLHAGAARARRAPRLCRRCRPRPASSAQLRPQRDRLDRSEPTSARSIRRACPSRRTLPTIDVSFISLKLVLPASETFCSARATPRRADQAAVRGRASRHQEGHRARPGGPSRGVRRDRRVPRRARMARRRRRIPRRSSAATATANSSSRPSVAERLDHRQARASR